MGEGGRANKTKQLLLLGCASPAPEMAGETETVWRSVADLRLATPAQHCRSGSGGAAKDELNVPSMWVCYTECSSGLTSSKALKWLTATKALITSVISQCRDEELDSRAERWQEQLEAINAAVALVPTDGGVAVCSLNLSV